MPSTHVESRRQFLRTGGATMLVVATGAGCDLLSTQAEGGGGGSAAAGPKGKEAPMLARLVEKGELPPVEQRLPQNPLVVEPNDRVGVYGGEWRSATLGVADWPWLGRTVGYENLTRWSVDWSEVIPNLAERYEVSEDAREVTYTLRKGLKWSDGEPFTADDVVFAQNDIFADPKLYPDGGADPGRAKKHDDRTFTISFRDPNALYVQYDLLHYQIVSKPLHYLKKFHKKYNPDVDALAEEEGFDSWIALLDSKAGITDSALFWQNPDIPVMYAWKVVRPLGSSGRMTLERNPYYWKVDPDGSQLPYLDRVAFEVIADEQVMLTRALNGDFSMHMRHFNTLQNKPVLARNRKRGGYDFFDSKPSEMNTCLIALNLTHEDSAKRELFRTRDFRVALSHAINRDEIIDVVYQQQGEPWQAAPRREVPFFHETLAKQYTEYDVDKANSLLDGAGFDQKDGDGVRLGPGGRPIRFTVEVATDFRPDQIDALDMVSRYWKKVGVDMNVKAEDRSLFYERKEANKHDAVVWPGDSGLLDAMLDPRWYIPTNRVESAHGVLWARWYDSDGADGEEPPESVKKGFALYDRLLATPEKKGQYDMMRRILDIAAEDFLVMGLNLSPRGYGIVANDFHNVPGSIYDAALYNNPAPTNPEQYFVQS
jgi:peptide/nickel transport system substrate-binding protein